MVVEKRSGITRANVSWQVAPAEQGHGTKYHALHEKQERWNKVESLVRSGVGGLQ